jgi:uncharacterized iron-regulated membrane protein
MTSVAKTKSTFVQRALAGHAAIGLLACAILYIIALSGSIVVIHDRLQRWEQPSIAEMQALSPAAAQAGMIAALSLEQGKPRTTHLYIRMPTDDLPRAVVTTDHAAWYINEKGGIAGREAHSWTEFVIAMHEYLHLPTTIGLIVVGAFGVALVALVLTGVLAHPRIVRDAFRLRTRHDPQIARADWHNRLGVWTLPFVLAVALTGAFIGLANVGATVLARAYSGGDVDKIYAPIFGQERRANAAPASLPDIAAALISLQSRASNARPTYVIAHDPGTRGQHVQIIAEHPRRLIYGETYAFDAAGHWRGAVGLSDGPLGQQAAASAYNLHFGNFGGLAVELAYMAFGLSLCVVTATGTMLWLQKRQRRGYRDDRLRAAWCVVIWGTPILILWTIWLRALAGPDAPLAASFWAALAAALIVSMMRSAWILAWRLRLTLCLSAILTAVIHLGMLRPASPEVVALDVIVLTAGLLPLIVTKFSSVLRRGSEGHGAVV